MRLRAAVVGHPVFRSLSPRIFRSFSSATGRPLDYVALDLSPEALAPAILEAASGRFLGWNVTIPYKVAVLAHLDAADDSAREAGAANVLHFLEGRRRGHNTDVEGFLAPLERRGLRIDGARAAVLGTGGASRAVCAALRRAGAREIRIVGRNETATRALAERWDAEGLPWTSGEVADAVAWAGVVVNATPLGSDGASSPLPPGARFRHDAIAVDLVYRFRETPFLRRASECRARALTGLGMLVAQAAATWRIWTGDPLPAGLADRVEAALEREAP